MPGGHLLRHLRLLHGLANPLLGLLGRRGAHPGHANPWHGPVLRHGPSWCKLVRHDTLTRRPWTRHTLMALRSHRPLRPLHGARPELRIELLGIVIASSPVVPHTHVVKMLLLLLTLLHVVACVKALLLLVVSKLLLLLVIEVHASLTHVVLHHLHPLALHVGHLLVVGLVQSPHARLVHSTHDWSTWVHVVHPMHVTHSHLPHLLLTTVEPARPELGAHPWHSDIWIHRPHHATC